MTVNNNLNSMLNNKTGEQACSIERVYFVKTDRTANPKKVNPFKAFPGVLPVLVSAPHSVRHIRHKKIKPSDEFTGSMASLLNSLTGCHSLAVTKLYGGDPNFDDNCIYKTAVAKLCEEQKITLVMDIHGASRDHDFDLDIGTMKGRSLLGHPEYTRLLKEHLARYGITRISENHFTVAGHNTVTNFVSNELGIPVMQLEINKRFRVPHQNPTDYCRMLAALTSFITDPLFSNPPQLFT